VAASAAREAILVVVDAPVVVVAVDDRTSAAVAVADPAWVAARGLILAVVAPAVDPIWAALVVVRAPACRTSTDRQRAPRLPRLGLVPAILR
jgi:hypothetical protein